MSTYVFKAMDLTGAKATGEVEAESKQVVSEQLKSRGLIVLDIERQARSRQINIELSTSSRPTDLAVMTRQLATMVQSGMTILRALYVLEAQTENKMLRRRSSRSARTSRPACRSPTRWSATRRSSTRCSSA